MEILLKNLPIDSVVVVLVILSGIFQRKYLKTVNINGAWKTLIVSAVFTVIYALLVALAGNYTKDLPLKWFFSYVTATSLYQLFLKKFLLKYFPESTAKKAGFFLLLAAPADSTHLSPEQVAFLHSTMPFAYVLFCLLGAAIILLFLGILWISSINDKIKFPKP